MGENDEPPVWDISPLVESEDPEMVKKAIDGTLKLGRKIRRQEYSDGQECSKQNTESLGQNMQEPGLCMESSECR